MSFNQPRSDKNDAQYRKTGRSGSLNPQRGSSGAYGRGSGGPAPSPSYPSNRNYKKSNSNVQAGQSRAPSVPIVNTSSESYASAPRGVQNGAHIQPQFHGASDAPVPVPAPAAKQVESSAAPRSSRGVPKAPTLQSATLTTGATAPPAATPTKTPGDGSKPILQFGSISPGFVNGMQIPARTNSAPPNLDEQKRNQARQDSYRPTPAPAAPALPTPIPKQQVPRKDHGPVDHPSAPEAHPIPKVRKDVHVSPAPPQGQSQKPSVLPTGGISMPIQFHQSPVSMSYGGHNQQMQPQGVAANSLQIQMPMPLSMGSGPQVQQPMYVPGLQPHPMQHQGIMHQGQNLSFPAQMAQHPNQLGNLGIGMGPQYPQQQGNKFAPPPPRKTPVKITNPKTHEEVRFDKRSDGYADGGSSGLRPHPNVPPQSQTIPPFGPSHPMNYYSAPYSNNMYYPNPSSQAARYNYPGNHGPQNVKIVNPSSLNALPVNKPSAPPMHGVLEQPNLEHSRDVQNSSSSVSSVTTHVTVKPPAGYREKGEPLSNNLTTVEKRELPKPSGLSAQVISSQSTRDHEFSSLQQSKAGSDSSVSESPVVPDQPAAKVSETAHLSTYLPSTIPPESVPVVGDAESRKQESLSRSNSIKDQKPVKNESSQTLHQIDDQPVPASSLPSQTSSESLVSESVDPKTTLSPQLINEDVPTSTSESVSTAPATIIDASTTESISESSALLPPENSTVSTAVDTSVSFQNSSLDDAAQPDNQEQHTSSVTEGQGGKELSEGIDEDVTKSEAPSGLNVHAIDDNEQARKEFLPEETSTSIVVPPSETKSTDESEESRCNPANDTVDDKVVEDSSGEKPSSSIDLSSSGGDLTGNDEVCVPKSGISTQQSPRALATEAPEHESETAEGGSSAEDVAGVGVPALAGSKDKPVPELTRSKSSISKGKKKRKEYLQKADAAGTTSDLYMAYKSPEEKKETLMASEVAESSFSGADSQEVVTDSTVEEVAAIENDEDDKAELDDWEDAADSSKPKLESENDGAQALEGDQDGESKVQQYTRDFLLTFADQCTDVPEGFVIATDLAGVLMSSKGSNTAHVVDRSPGRVIDRPLGTPRLDRRNSGVAEGDRWNKQVDNFANLGRGDMHLDLSFGLGNTGFRPALVGNFGVMKYPRVQSPVQYSGGILSAGPMQSVGPHGGIQRNNSDADRWQRSTSFQHRGLIPSPQTPLVTMHKSENRYEVGKVSDEESSKQRQLKAILNKLTPQNFDKLFEQVKAVDIDNAQTLRGVIGQIFDKALMEPTFCEMYADFCLHLSGELQYFVEDDVKITFKRLLLNKCQEEFERGEREEEEANKADEEGEVKQSEEEREEKRVKARRRMLGNIRLIGELFKKKMLTERIMHECINKLLGQHQTPDEEDIEALCKLMSTIGESIDHPKAKVFMDSYFDRMRNFSVNTNLSSRVRFMLKDSIDLRKNNWQQRRKVEGPKKIEEVHRDAAQERHAQTSRLNRGPSINSTGRRGGPVMDFSSRGSTVLPSTMSQMPSFRPLPSPSRGIGSQDFRAQRAGDDAITLGPQGGLARGMSSRGPVGETSPAGGDPRRFTAASNGYGSVSDRGYSPREDSIPRLVPERFSGQVAYDQSSSAQERNIYGSRDSRTTPDHGTDRPLLSSPPPSRGAAAQSISAEKVLSDEELRAKSRTAIKEYYSARDLEELSQCIKDLNSPSFHPEMVSIWVAESFEAKEMERELLAKLLVNLATSTSDSILTPTHLLKGFESVLETIEEFVCDAPKAPNYLGGIFAKVVTEKVVPLRDICQIIHAGGEEPGSLLKSGLAGEVLGSMLQIIVSVEGKEATDKLIKGASLRLETFRPPESPKSVTLENFILGL